MLKVPTVLKYAVCILRIPYHESWQHERLLSAAHRNRVPTWGLIYKTVRRIHTKRVRTHKHGNGLRQSKFRFIKPCAHTPERNVSFMNHSPPGNACTWLCLQVRPPHAHFQPWMVNAKHGMNIKLCCWPMGFHRESWRSHGIKRWEEEVKLSDTDIEVSVSEVEVTAVMSLIKNIHWYPAAAVNPASESEDDRKNGAWNGAGLLNSGTAAMSPLYII